MDNSPNEQRVMKSLSYVVWLGGQAAVTGLGLHMGGVYGWMFIGGAAIAWGAICGRYLS